ncbi:MAG: polyprenyl synthetase family protein [Candidatus Heimdallarchaeota archaeon]|nr:polyprenyl synthetase family protein [Candidatus Heimdallarchaeota archaeon]
MTNSSLEKVFAHMSKLGKTVEEKMIQFLLKDIHPNFAELITWQTKTGGKRLRPALTILFAQACGSDENDPETLAAAAGIELIHTYSLILDDIIDRGDIRRGKSTTRAKYGDEFAILSAIIHREAVYEAARATGKYLGDTLGIYTNAIRRLTEGERLDILFEQKGERENEYFLTHRFKEVGLKDYRRMIAGKTASLIAAACKLGALVGGASLEEQACAEKYGWSAGIAFQLADDYLDIFAVSEEFGKEVYKDIIERKLGNFVIVEALRLLVPSEAKKLSGYITDENLSDEERIEKCIPLIDKSKAKEEVMKEAEKWAQKAIMTLETVEFKNEDIKDMLVSIAQFSVRRAF